MIIKILCPAATGARTSNASPLEYRASAKAVHGGDAEVAAAQVFVRLDAGWATPPTGAPGRADLLGSAFAARLLKNLARADALRVSTEEPERRVELVHSNLRKFGTVFNTPAAVCEVHGTVTAVPTTQKSGSAHA